MIEDFEAYANLIRPTTRQAVSDSMAHVGTQVAKHYENKTEFKAKVVIDLVVSANNGNAFSTCVAELHELEE